MDARWKREGRKLHGHSSEKEEGKEADKIEAGAEIQDPNVFPTGKPHLVDRYPVVLIAPAIAFGALLYLLIIMWL